MKCRHCNNDLSEKVLDLGSAPPSNAYLTKEMLSSAEVHLPLVVRVCDKCWLVQTEDYTRAEQLFDSEYAYFSSTSTSWLAHAEVFSQKIIKRLELGQKSNVIEIASNDGYLLKNFVKHGIPCLGVEPTKSTADAAIAKGIPVLQEFFTESLAKRIVSDGSQADLVVGNNVFAHVPNVNDFTVGIKKILKPRGVVSLEFPHLAQMIQQSQFDTVYHEHFSYFSLLTVEQIFKLAGLRIWDVEELVTHGGSLRVYGCHDNDPREATSMPSKIVQMEKEMGLNLVSGYRGFQSKADDIKYGLIEFLLWCKRKGLRVAAYGAAAKGNTLLNYSGIKPDLLPFVCDASPSKQGKWMPGSRIPIFNPSGLIQFEPDYILVLPWNIVDEVRACNQELICKGAKFVTAVPNIRII
jgi:hypothetical protein